MGRRTLLLITSILIAAVGTALIGLYVRGANDRAIGDNTVQKVLVASHQIAAGATVGAGDYEVGERRAGDLPSDLLNSSQVTGRAVGPILKGQILESPMLTTSGAVTGNSGIDPGQVGIVLELQDPERAAGLLKVGSKIDVYSIINNNVSDPAVLSSVKVIAIGPNNIADTADDSAATGDTTDQVPTTLVALTLSDPQVVKVKTAEAKGKLFFAVLPGESK